MKLKLFLKFIFLTLLLITVGCVGTVQEATPPESLQMTNPPVTFNFPGIVTARGIAHNKVELEFYSAGSSGITYQLYINDSTTPITVDLKSLITVAGGKLLYTVKNLVSNREYKFKMRAINTKTGAVSTKENEAFARTFDNVVANFDGVAKLSLVPGNTSSAINVDWIAPSMSGILDAGPYDPANYEITVISEIGGLANLNNPTYAGTDKKIILVPTPPARANPFSNPSYFSVDGLASSTTYFVQVRAINALYQDFAQNPEVTTIPVNREMNTRVLSIKTESGGELPNFRQDQVILANAPGQDAYDKIDVFWKPGTGLFTGYRIFVREYDGVSDPANDDKLTEATLVSMSNSGQFTAVSTSFNSKRISGLASWKYYQVKVALCRSQTCPVASSDANPAIISDLKTIRIKPTLAPFTGVNSIEPPGQFNQIDVVNLKFDAPLAGQGFATTVELYCVDPTDKSQMVKLDFGAPITGSSVSNCNGLYLDGAAPGNISTYSSQKVRGLVTNGTRQYCFAGSPAIIGYGDDIRLPVASMIIRCSYPEVVPPTIAQFPGLKKSCAVNATNAKVDWTLPTGGIYSGYRVFVREKTSANKFSFPEAISGAASYTVSSAIDTNTLTYTVPNLMPGRTYQIGVLAEVDLPPGQKDLYSEYNLNIVDCDIPLPIAKFKGFSRIFAIGPKTDGRYPNDPATRNFPSESYLYEAINADGIPYEVSMDNIGVPSLTANFVVPPGRDAGANFAASFDGQPGSLGYSMSNTGVVSLAWEEVEMDYPEADAVFAANMPSTASRTGRQWGYKVFRSADNKLTWQELTGTNGNVYSMSFSYAKRPGASNTTTKMGFFTDYSVRALSEAHDATTGRDIERARTYYYRIVPVFDGKLLKYDSGSYHTVMVTLPPPNMALVHRWMANRARCLEIEKNPDIKVNYTCAYNGIGSKPRGFPYRVGDTTLDQEGDLLVDRYELGCRFTRGERTNSPETSASNFKLAVGSKRDINDPTYYPLFRGYSTMSESEVALPFRGCIGENSNTAGVKETGEDYPQNFVANYQYALQGDCIGSHGERIAMNTCTASQYNSNEYDRYYVTVPGAPNAGPNAITPDCSQNNPMWPTDLNGKYSGSWAPNMVMQSEFLAVFYNLYTISSTSSQTYTPRVEAPATGSVASSRFISKSVSNGLGASQCSINLASISSDGYMRPRWLNLNDLGGDNIEFKGVYGNLLDKTVAEVTEVKAAPTAPLTFYNGVQDDGTPASFKLPAAGLRSSARYRSTTRLAKIMTSNASKLPPIGKLNTKVANRICNNYFVQTGFAADNGTGTVFAPTAQAVAKRSLRRAESVTVSAWPDHYSTAQIQDIESSASSGSCNGNLKGISGADIVKGAAIDNRHVYKSGFNNLPLLTGSSNFLGKNTLTSLYHTNRCISRYGVQDVVGNLSEANTETIFCDYSKDSIYMGSVTSNWSGGTGAINAGGADGVKFPFFNSTSERNNWVIMRQGSPKTGNTSFEMRFNDPTYPTRTDFKPWIEISVDSGYCSIVDDLPTRRTQATDIFKDISTGFWTPIYFAGGALNTAMISKTQDDQDAIKNWRNGDGRFLDFGPMGIGAAINKSNTLALNLNGITSPSSETASSKYFNPWIGLPLKCQSSSCNDPMLDGTQNDNTSITTTYLNNNVSPDPTLNDIPSITDFFVGKSQITNMGISDFTYTSTGWQTMQIPMNGGASGSFSNVLVAAVADNPITMQNLTFVTKNVATDFQPGSTLDYYRVLWDVERGTSFGINSGGKASSEFNGRYSALILPSSWAGYGTDDPSRGARCSVLINQDP